MQDYPRLLSRYAKVGFSSVAGLKIVSPVKNNIVDAAKTHAAGVPPGSASTGEHDIYASTAGGARLREPGLDLGVCLAITSAITDRPLPADLAMFGEVGLGGELRQS